MDQEIPDLRDCLALWSVPGIGSMMSKRIISYSGGIKQLFKLKTAICCVFPVLVNPLPTPLVATITIVAPMR